MRSNGALEVNIDSQAMHRLSVLMQTSPFHTRVSFRHASIKQHLNIFIHHCWQTTKKQINRIINKQIQIAERT